MTFPKTRISITLAERELLMPGLLLLANGLVNAKNGVFPNRHALDRIDPVRSDIYRDRCYSAEMAMRVQSVRCDLLAGTTTQKPYFDVFELSTAALALRVSGSLSRRAGDVPPAKEMKALSRKLETNRKRAQRLAVGKVGRAAFLELTETWRLHLAWARYNLLQFSVAKPVKWNSKPLMREQRQALVSMITQAIEERRYAALSSELTARMALLAKNDLRRGRLTMTLRELLAAGRAGRELLFAFVEKRVVLVALPGAKIEPGRAAMARAEIFQSAYGKVLSAPRY
jgi:hypothetical protein